MSTSISNKEYLEIFKSTGETTGRSCTKNYAHSKGIWHQTAHCWFVYQDVDGIDKIIVQKRSLNKSNWPGRIDITAAGHVMYKETPVEGCLREIKEELGITLKTSDLLYAGRRICVEDFQVGSLNREFQEIYFYRCRLSELKFNCNQELSGLFIVSVDEALELFAHNIQELQAFPVIPLSIHQKIITITREDFIPTLDGYYYKIMILAKRILANERHLII